MRYARAEIPRGRLVADRNAGSRTTPAPLSAKERSLARPDRGRRGITSPMAFRRLASLGLLVSGAVLLAQPAPVPPPLTEAERTALAYTLAHYTKYEYRIPMRDGVRLFAAVYVPKDTTQSYPILMQRTPYNVGPYGADNYKPQIGPSLAAEKEGFVFAYER